MKRLKCTFKWEHKSVRLNGKQMSTFKLQEKSVRLNCKEKVYV